MPAESASAAANTGINSPGGSIAENSPGVIALAVVAVVVIFFIFYRLKKKRKGGA